MEDMETLFAGIIPQERGAITSILKSSKIGELTEGSLRFGAEPLLEWVFGVQWG